MEKALIASKPQNVEGLREQIFQVVSAGVRKGSALRGISYEGLKRVEERSGELINRILDDIRELSFKLPDFDCFTIADWSAHYRIAFTPEQVAVAGNFPWSTATLNSACPFNPGKMVRETHFAFFGVDTITMMELQRLNPKATEPRFYQYGEEAWYRKEKFATETKLALRWYLLLKDIVPNSENKTFKEQQAMLPKKYEAPTAVAETAKDLLHYKKTGKYVNANCYARTSELDSGGNRVLVGNCVGGGIAVNVWQDDGRRVNVGVGACRKFDKNRS